MTKDSLEPTAATVTTADLAAAPTRRSQAVRSTHASVVQLQQQVQQLKQGLGGIGGLLGG